MFLRTLVLSLTVVGGLSAMMCNGRAPLPALTCSLGVATPPEALPITAVAYMAMAAAGDQFEIQSSQIALVKASSPDVRNFAQMLINDHAAMSSKMMAAAASAGLMAPAPAFSADQQRMLNELQLEPAGPSFDQLFLRDQIFAHQLGLALHSNYAAFGDTLALRAVASSAVPIIQMHLSTAEQLMIANGGMMTSDFCPANFWCNSDVDAFGQRFSVCCPSDVPMLPPVAFTATVAAAPAATTVYASAAPVAFSTPIYASAAPAATTATLYSSGSFSGSTGYIRAFGTVVPAVRVPSNAAGGLGNVPVGTPAVPLYTTTPLYTSG